MRAEVGKPYPPVVQLGKFGDIIAILPALKEIGRITGTPPILVVSQACASLLQGVSYVKPLEVESAWPDGVPAARAWAVKMFGACVVPQFWNDPEYPQPVPAGQTEVTCHGKKWALNDQVWPNYMAAMWGMLGFTPDEMAALPLVFDRRNPEREAKLVARFIHGNKPTLLLNFTSASSPFGFEPEVLRAINAKDFSVVLLNEIKCERLYDLLGLYDAAAGMLTCATATLHLAAASKIQYIAFTEDDWSRAVPKGNVVANVAYSTVRQKLPLIGRLVNNWTCNGPQIIPRKKLDPEDPPSITEQTDWRCEFFTFKYAQLRPSPGIEFFNCGLVARTDGDWLVVRRSIWRREVAFGMNDLVAFKLNGMFPTGGHAVHITRTMPEEHFEDPRVIEFEGRTWVSANNFVWGKVWPHAHQVLAEVTNDWKEGPRRDIAIGHNGTWVKGNTGSEKNWLWFFDEGLPHLLYLAVPHTVVRFDRTFKVREIFETQPEGFKWEWGIPRGGTPPILVDGEYWTFFHSSVCHASAGRRYFMGAYAFEAKPPYRMLRYTARPLLYGNAKDIWFKGKPLVVFPCGAIYRDGNWTISIGINDLACAWITIPHGALPGLCASVPHSQNLRASKVMC